MLLLVSSMLLLQMVPFEYSPFQVDEGLPDDAFRAVVLENHFDNHLVCDLELVSHGPDRVPAVSPAGLGLDLVLPTF